jgi:hypothetical protein
MGWGPKLPSCKRTSHGPWHSWPIRIQASSRAMGQWLLPTIPTSTTHTHVRSHVHFSSTKNVAGWGPKLPSCKLKNQGRWHSWPMRIQGSSRAMGQWLLPTIPTNITHTHVRSHVHFSSTKNVTGWGPKSPSCKRRSQGPWHSWPMRIEGYSRAMGQWLLSRPAIARKLWNNAKDLLCAQVGNWMNEGRHFGCKLPPGRIVGELNACVM